MKTNEELAKEKKILHLGYSYTHFRGWNGVLAEFFYNFTDKEWKRYS